MKGLVVGLTGGIGSGKTAAADRFAEFGAAIIDTDAIAHELTGPHGAAMPAVREAFGTEVVAADGSLDRAAMRQLVFGDATRRERLEAILHPMIRAACDARCAEALATGAPYVVLVVPLLVESGDFLKRYGRIAVVDCPEALQIKRVMARNGLSAAEVEAIMGAQASREQRRAVADDIIRNDAGLDALQRQAAELHVKYCALAEKIREGG